MFKGDYMARTEDRQRRWQPLLPVLEQSFEGHRLIPEKLTTGWSILNQNKQQLCTLYYRNNKAEHCLELAVSPSQPLGIWMGEQVALWVEQEIISSGRRGKVHSHFPFPVGHWPTLGFVDEAQALHFFERVLEKRLMVGLPVAYEHAVMALPEHTVVERITKQRRGQAMLRRVLLLARGGRCELTGLAVPRLLRCSHIKAWAEASRDERFNLDNCLLLSPHVDALFDAGFLTFDPRGTALFSHRLRPADLAALGLSIEARLITMPNLTQQNFLTWHRNYRVRE
ncbi:HNH endonuclease [Janthinobacterium sp. MDT1-19]|uniref:HNH endonuclease n=1 Tax=Janthinobacterium sp. MDT1-19 TaxID=1259339 RepID=UPI003F1FA9CB